MNARAKLLRYYSNNSNNCCTLITTGCPKSHDPNVRAYCSAGDVLMRIILSDMSCIFHSFEESINCNFKIVHFLMNFVHFCCFWVSEDTGSHYFVVHCVWRLKLHLPWKNGISSYSDNGDIKHYASVHYVGSGDYHLIEVHPYALWEPNQLLDGGVVSPNPITAQSILLTRIAKCLITPSFQHGFA